LMDVDGVEDLLSSNQVAVQCVGCGRRFNRSPDELERLAYCPRCRKAPVAESDQQGRFRRAARGNDLIGKTIGELTVLRVAPRQVWKTKNAEYRCMNNETRKTETVRGDNLRRKRSALRKAQRSE
jgi:hypothetical protein